MADETISETDDGQRRQRGRINFPYADLNDAIDVARATWDDGGGRSQLDRLAARLGHENITSGAFRVKITAAKLFGLVTVSGMDVILTDDLGRRIVDPAREHDARIDAFLNVPLYQQLYEWHRVGVLPGPSAIEQEMLDLGVASGQKERARQVFQRSAEQAGFFSQGRDRLLAPMRTEGSGERREDLRSGGQRPSPVVEPPAIQGLHPAVQGLILTLIRDGESWSVDRQQRFLTQIRETLRLLQPEEEETP